MESADLSAGYERRALSKGLRGLLSKGFERGALSKGLAREL